MVGVIRRGAKWRVDDKVGGGETRRRNDQGWDDEKDAEQRGGNNEKGVEKAGYFLSSHGEHCCNPQINVHLFSLIHPHSVFFLSKQIFGSTSVTSHEIQEEYSGHYGHEKIGVSEILNLDSG